MGLMKCQKASIADKLDLRGFMGTTFFLVNLLSAVLLGAEFDVPSPRALGGALLSVLMVLLV